jgi:hypothetical protein
MTRRSHTVRLGKLAEYSSLSPRDEQLVGCSFLHSMHLNHPHRWGKLAIGLAVRKAGVWRLGIGESRLRHVCMSLARL